MAEDDRELNPEPADDQEFVRSLLERAGPRPPISQQDLEAIAASARGVWQAELRKRARGSVLRAGRRRTLWPLVTSLAAALLLTVGLAWWSAANDAPAVALGRVESVTGQVTADGPEGGPQPLVAAAELGAGAHLRSNAGRASLRLASGAVVRVDQDTRVQLVAAAALLLESGALYVDTGAGGGARIEVRTPAGLVRDIGTRFAVRVGGSEGAALRVQVRDGSVEVERGARRELAGAGEELLVGADGAAERRRLDPFGSEWEWTLAAAAAFPIEGRSLSEFLAWVAHETGWQIRFADSALAAAAERIRLHGGIGSLRPDQAPFAVLPGAGLEGRLEAEVLVIERLPELRTPR